MLLTIDEEVREVHASSHSQSAIRSCKISGRSCLQVALAQTSFFPLCLQPKAALSAKIFFVSLRM